MPTDESEHRAVAYGRGGHAVATGHAAAATVDGLSSLLAPEAIRCPHPAYARLRRERPVSYLPEQDLWVVSRYHDCEYVLAHPEIFSSQESMSSTNAYRRSQDALAVLRRSRAYPRVRTLVMTDPPEHTRYRRIMQWVFAPARTVRELTSPIRAMVDQLIDGFASTGRCEFVSQFAYPLPMRVIARVLDVPDEHIETLKTWSDDFISVQAGNIEDSRLVPAAKRVLEFENYFIAKLQERQRHPQDDLLGRLVNLPDGESPLGLPEVLSLLTQMMVAGNESTTNFLGNATYLLVTTDRLIMRLRHQPNLIPELVEEILRFESPVQGLFRVAIQDTEINGTMVPAGAKLMVNFGSANRDEMYYDDEFDPDRDNRSTMHMAFGRGIHSCLGQALARREGVCAIERLVERLPHLRLDPDREVLRQTLFGIRGMRELHLRFTPAETGGGDTGPLSPERE